MNMIQFSNILASIFGYICDIEIFCIYIKYGHKFSNISIGMLMNMIQFSNILIRIQFSKNIEIFQYIIKY